ncbi:MAG: hypothetical protein WCF92_03930 [bacterium]
MSGKNTYLYSSFGFLILLLLVHSFATYTGLYWITGWFDTVSHLLGGFVIFFGFSYIFSFKNKKPTLGVIIILSLLVGIIWELFELKYGITSLVSRKYISSTSIDLIFDIIGSCLAFLIVKKYGSK